MTTLLIDIQLGPGSLGEVARRMGDAVAWPASTVPTIVAVMEAAQVLADVRADGRSWDAVVGLGYGCGPAAALVRDGAVGRAVLIDPPPMFAHNDFGLAWLEMATHGEPPAEAPCIETLPLQPEPDVVEAVDWMHAWQEADLDITVWLPVEHHPLVSALRRRAPGRPLAAKPWDALIWATAPEVLAAELAEAVGWVVPRS